jgi:hypothetical protein
MEPLKSKNNHLEQKANNQQDRKGDKCNALDHGPSLYGGKLSTVTVRCHYRLAEPVGVPYPASPT